MLYASSVMCSGWETSFLVCFLVVFERQIHNERTFYKLFSFVGIIEVSLDRPEAKNAIGREMLHGLSHVLELINRNSDANVAMICSSVPGVFCAGADLKVYQLLFFYLNLRRKKPSVFNIIFKANYLL